MKRSSLGLPFVCQLWVAGMLLVACGGNGHKGGGALHNDTAQKRPAQPAQSDRAGTDTSLLTIAAINELPDGQNIEIRFYERAAAFSVPKSDKVFSANSELLRKALADNTPVKFVLAPRSNRIAQIIMPTEMEVRAYNTGSGLNSPDLRIKSTVPITVDLTKIDTATFNRVERLRFPAFKLCGSVVPNYATLVTIFNYCASQGCNVPGPYTIPNCIPFQYVIDGCYARAHKMRQIIGKQYGYCCEKVFSYGISPSTLAVKADKWGGCCVRWWYHVAPLLRVTVKRGASSFQLAYVIDPGMFNGPVTLSTWLNAQKNTTCASNANVTSYSIQPGSAYAPSNGGYSTDPNYTATEQTLVAYKNGVTCN